MLTDGVYDIDVTLNGGSGRASVKSPTEITVENGEVSAKIEWSSSNYDYMSVGGKDYYPVNENGNSTFLIEVPTLDSDIEIAAETVAMSEPHTIDYTLYFDSSTAVSYAKENSAAAVFIVGAALAAAVVFAVVFGKKKKNEKN